MSKIQLSQTEFVVMGGLIAKGTFGCVHECTYNTNNNTDAGNTKKKQRLRYVVKIQPIDDITSIQSIDREVYHQKLASELSISP